jgi:hypothetical protein
MAKGLKTGGRVAVYSAIDFICQSCGKSFRSDKACKGRLPKYCSRECAALSKIRWSICLNCGKQYRTSKEAGNRNKCFCSMDCAGAYKKGKPLSEAWKSALSDAKKGKPIPHLHTSEVVAKISKSLTGKPQPWMRGTKHPNYKNGGAGYSERITAMGKLEYKNWRRFVFERDGYSCQQCQQSGKRLQAHHKKSWANYPELRYEVDNGITLCLKCHREFHRGHGERTGVSFCE